MTRTHRLVPATFVAALVAASIPAAHPAVAGAAVPQPCASSPRDRVAVAERQSPVASGVPQRSGAV